MNNSWSKLSALRFTIEEVKRTGMSLEVSPVFKRHTTILQLTGHSQHGFGEDVVYETQDQQAFQAATLPTLAGTYTLAEFSEKLDELDLFCGSPPTRSTSRDYRRWTFESAALDLALKQNKLSLASALGRQPMPLSYVISLGLGRPPSAAPVLERLARQSGMQFKLDADQAWDKELCSALAATGAVQTVDLKGYYTGTPVDLDADPALYQLVAETFPTAWIEDPVLNGETLAVLAPHSNRISMDAPIHRIEDLAQFPIELRCVNIKPSRSGRLQDLLNLVEHCEQNAISMYAGGQFELGVGRRQVQHLASLFHADGCNDCSPVSFHTATLKDEWPSSPLPVPAQTPGLGLKD